MPREYEITDELHLDATPEEVWDAIATGPGVDSWFMGRTTFEGGTRRLDMSEALGFTQESAITAWEPRRRLAFREEGTGGEFAAVEYLLEARDGGGTVLRFVHAGMLGGDWDDEYVECMRAGDLAYPRQLAAYVRHFAGRYAVRGLFLAGPPAQVGGGVVWERFAAALSLDAGGLRDGAAVRVDVPGLSSVEGSVAFTVAERVVGVRLPDALLMLMRGHRDGLVAAYHGFAANDSAADSADTDIEIPWRNWLAATATP